jgi:serine O-acetyltransferase
MIRLVIRALFQADIPTSLEIPRSVIFMHNGLGTVIHPDVHFEGEAIIFHHVTLGNSWGKRDGTPTIGANVLIGVGAVVLGPVQIGDGAIIGANAVVLQDVPPRHTAIGAPARLLPPGSEAEL